MFASIARSAHLNAAKILPRTSTAVARPGVAPFSAHTNLRILNNYNNNNNSIGSAIRYFSSTDPSVFKPDPPPAITRDTAEGIQDTTLFYLRNGISQQRLSALSKDTESSLTMKWQRMMEIYLSTQVFVISGLGYSGDEQGLQMYTHHLATFMADKCDEDERETYRKVGNETWRELLATAFDLDLDNIQSVNIADARNMMHKVSSKMQEPSVLMKIQKECSKLLPRKCCSAVLCSIRISLRCQILFAETLL